MCYSCFIRESISREGDLHIYANFGFPSINKILKILINKVKVLGTCYHYFLVEFRDKVKWTIASQHKLTLTILESWNMNIFWYIYTYLIY